MSMVRYNLLHTLWSLWRGQTTARVFLNVALSKEILKGKVVDIGGGHKPDYFNYFQKDPAGVTIEAIDASITGVDFEKDTLPYRNNSVDTIILCNILEHMYNYNFLLSEIYRIMKPTAQVIGFVPFWVGYHPDPHDYFRYSDECLLKIFQDIGFKNIQITRIGRGPILANFNTIVLSLPRFLRPIVFIPYNMADLMYIWLRPNGVKRNPLGYLFTLSR